MLLLSSCVHPAAVLFWMEWRARCGESARCCEFSRDLCVYHFDLLTAALWPDPHLLHTFSHPPIAPLCMCRDLLIRPPTWKGLPPLTYSPLLLHTTSGHIELAQTGHGTVKIGATLYVTSVSEYFFGVKVGMVFSA